ncbi:hypothetical protein EVB81_209 [Rhizobium phage RHph_I46]|uniref:Uncharacterized protein n=1 Tax=Rhizobium phage RHph_I1_9 TaxID=2509729 RepID=A0A7S5UY86_9CAUD|nr:hypothetical protein PP936_gp207 [Rhizobium phage RHph_I1_9]QIG69778.1 hypothetical protein EVB81_209 [Rhizobium phage RHph_I46]QIG71059.1 hypothetical protein EVB92_209 [Rhizobium phage RHph_I9]QIG73644.1 hypothetical protein EVC04_207 [Rhizobium phage RHph_I1_9]QIG76398.1 hypothetical protein EVC25_209 [Rhizobium phage RHph_I34]
MFTRIRVSFGNHSVLVLETLLSSVKESQQDLIAHFCLVMGAVEEKFEISIEGAYHFEIDQQIAESLPTWIANYKSKTQITSYMM